MISRHVSVVLLITVVSISPSLAIIYLENCTYSLDLYQHYFNLLGSLNDSRALHIQAIYSLPSNQSEIPGQIYTYSSRSVALIPFFVRCSSSPSVSYLPFTQCSSTITNLKKNYESTRTHLPLKSLSTLDQVPLLYMGEYRLLLSNCSFRRNSITYQLKANEVFSLHVEYESSILSTCTSCNQRTSICHEKTCRCRSGTIAMKLVSSQYFCVDITRNCTLDPQRCLSLSTSENDRSRELMLILIVLIGFVLILFVSLLWCLFRKSPDQPKDVYSNQSIFIIDKEERTSSTISTTDSIKLTVENEYPRIIGDENNGEIVFILA